MIHDDLPRQARDKRKEMFLYTGFVDLGGGTHCGQSFWCETRTPFSFAIVKTMETHSSAKAGSGQT